MACRNMAISESAYDYFPNPTHYDEMVTSGNNRPHYQHVAEWLDQTPLDSILQSRHQADAIFRQQGITFTVYERTCSIVF